MKNLNRGFFFRMSDEHFRLLTKLSERTGYSKGAYLRMLIENKLPQEKPTEAYQEVMLELRRIGNSMNKIASAAREHGFMDAKMYGKNCTTLWNAVLELQKAQHPQDIHGNY